MATEKQLSDFGEEELPLRNDAHDLSKNEPSNVGGPAAQRKRTCFRQSDATGLLPPLRCRGVDRTKPQGPHRPPVAWTNPPEPPTGR